MATLKLPEQPGQRKLPWKVMLLVAAVLAALAVGVMAATMLIGGSGSTPTTEATDTGTQPNLAPSLNDQPSRVTDDSVDSQNEPKLAVPQTNPQVIVAEVPGVPDQRRDVRNPNHQLQSTISSGQLTPQQQAILQSDKPSEITNALYTEAFGILCSGAQTAPVAKAVAADNAMFDTWITHIRTLPASGIQCNGSVHLRAKFPSVWYEGSCERTAATTELVQQSPRMILSLSTWWEKCPGTKLVLTGITYQ